MAYSTEDDVSQMIHKEYENCERCPDLCKLRTQVVWGYGNERCDIMLVGEAPGREEDLQGKPFIGAAGQFLDQFLEQAGLVRSEVYITNAVMCRPTRPSSDGGFANRPPTSVEVANCRERLHREIIAVDPIVIVALGDVAATALRGKKTGIKKARGNIVDITIKTSNNLVLSYAMLPVFHPAYLLRTRSEEDMYHTVSDLRRAKELVDRFKSVAARLHE